MSFENPKFIAPPDRIEVDRRDWNSFRERLLHVEEVMIRLDNENVFLKERLRDCQSQLALYMSGTKERFDFITKLLEK
jgi:hypothetical protein